MANVDRLSWKEVAKLDLGTFKLAAKVGLEDEACVAEWREFLITSTWLFLQLPLQKWLLRMIPWMVKTGRGLGRRLNGSR
ncbi:hypothetical protein ES703_114509 [subsurface metagenome]